MIAPWYVLRRKTPLANGARYFALGGPCAMRLRNAPGEIGPDMWLSPVGPMTARMYLPDCDQWEVLTENEAAEKDEREALR